MDYIKFWTGFQKRIDQDNNIKALFDDTRNETGRGKDKNSFVFDFKVGDGDDKIPYNIIPLVNTRVPFISVDMYFKRKRKHAQELLDFFVEERQELEKRLGKSLYISDPNKSEVRISLRRPLSEFDVSDSEDYYAWFIKNMVTMRSAFEGLRSEKGFYPERSY